MAVRVRWAALDVAAPPAAAVRVRWAELDVQAQQTRVRVHWAELDVRAPVAPPPTPPKANPPGGGGYGYHRSYSQKQHLIPVELAPDATEEDEEEIILALLMEIATHVV